MSSSPHLFLIAPLWLVWMLQGCASTDSAAPATAAPAAARITVLYDAFGKDAEMTRDWGYSALVEMSGKRILFDTGDDPQILAKNVKAKGVDLTRLDFVVLSHRHARSHGRSDLSAEREPESEDLCAQGNLRHLRLRPAKQVLSQGRIAACRDALLRRPHRPRSCISAPPFPGANIQLIDKTTEVAPGITLIALVSDVPGTKELKELSLAINTSEGIVLVVACSHPGIEAIVAEAAKIHPHNPCHRGWVPPGGGAGSGHREGRHRPARHLQGRLHRSRSLHRRGGPSPRCKRRSANATSMPDWGTTLGVGCGPRAPIRIEAPPTRWTKAIYAAIARCSPRATIRTAAARAACGSRK